MKAMANRSCYGVEAALSQIATWFNIWHPHSQERLQRTAMDIILSERVAANNAAAVKSNDILFIESNYSIRGQTVDTSVEVFGKADCAIGRHYTNPKESDFITNAIVMYANRPDAFFHHVLAHTIAMLCENSTVVFKRHLLMSRLGRLQQVHAEVYGEDRIQTIYSIVSNGWCWRFLKLEASGKLAFSAELSLGFGSQRTQM